MKKIGIIMGSDSDLPVVEKAIETLEDLDIPYEVHVYSAHRTPAIANDFSRNARKNGFAAIIAAAGKAAHLAGAINSHQVQYTRRGGCTAFYRTDAQWHPCCDGCHRWGQERRSAGGSDHRC